MRKEFEKSVRNKGGHSFVHGWLQFAVQEREREREALQHKLLASCRVWRTCANRKSHLLSKNFWRQHRQCKNATFNLSQLLHHFLFFAYFFFLFFFFFRAVTIHKSTNSRLKSLEKCVFQTALECRLDAFGTSARGSRGGIILWSFVFFLLELYLIL